MQDDEVRKELTLRVEPERAWELVSEPEHLEEWFAHEVELDPQEGGEVRVTGHDGIERDGTVEVVDAPRTIRFVWWQVPDGEPSRVEIALRPFEGGTRIEVTEHPLPVIHAVGGMYEQADSFPSGPFALAA